MNPILKRLIAGLVAFIGVLSLGLSEIPGGESFLLGDIGQIPLKYWLSGLGLFAMTFNNWDKPVKEQLK